MPTSKKESKHNLYTAIDKMMKGEKGKKGPGNIYEAFGLRKPKKEKAKETTAPKKKRAKPTKASEKVRNSKPQSDTDARNKGKKAWM